MALKQITRVNIAEKVFEQLRDQILQGTWKEGEKLPSEQELTETLGVSRSSVRQAIRTLADYGMVETRNGTGTYVKRQISGNYMLNIVPIGDLQFEDIVEVLDFLCLIEDSVAAMAVQRCTQEELAELQAIHKRLIAAKDQNDLEADQCGRGISLENRDDHAEFPGGSDLRAFTGVSPAGHASHLCDPGRGGRYSIP